jgi:hypothetical protein
MKKLVCLLVALAGCGSSQSGPPCTMDSQCASSSFCHFKVINCAIITPRSVTIAAGDCRAKGGLCAGADDCGPGEVCQFQKCMPFPDDCNIAPSNCTAGCTWQTHPCACVCDTCPASVDDGGADLASPDDGGADLASAD